MASVEEMTEKILYRLSLDPRARELAARVLERCRRLIGDLPASADHHRREPGGLFQHPLEVAVKMLEEFEGHITLERKGEGSVDSFQSARNRPRSQCASPCGRRCCFRASPLPPSADAPAHRARGNELHPHTLLTHTPFHPPLGPALSRPSPTNPESRRVEPLRRSAIPPASTTEVLARRHLI